MSTRTIIEINHDHLNRLIDDTINGGTNILAFLNLLCSTTIVGRLNNGDTPEPISGLRILAQRHHSDVLKLTIE